MLTDGQTDGQTDGRTEWGIAVALSQIGWLGAKNHSFKIINYAFICAESNHEQIKLSKKAVHSYKQCALINLSSDLTGHQWIW